MVEDKKNTLIEAIQRAFETTPYPARFDVKDFEGYHWRDLPGHVMFEWGDQLGQLSWGEFRFFMPAFMIFALKLPIEADVLVDGYHLLSGSSSA